MNGNVASSGIWRSWRATGTGEKWAPWLTFLSLSGPLACSLETATENALPERQAAVALPTEAATPSASTTDATAGPALDAVCLPSARPGEVGFCARLGQSWFRIWGAVRTGKMPKALATDHQGKYLYSSNMGSAGADGLSVYRTDPLQLERHVALNGHAVELLVAPDDGALWVSDADAWGKLKRYDTRDWTLQREIAVPGFPKWMVMNRDASEVFTSLWNLDGVSRVEVASGGVQTARTRRGKGSAKHSKNPRGMVLSSDEKELYVLNNHDHSLSILDATTLTESERIPVGYAPRHIVRATDETYWISLTGENAILEWSAKTRRTINRHAVGRRPKTIATSHDERYLYAANFVDDSLSVVDVASGQRVDLPLNLHKPSGLAVRADDHFVYVSGFCSNDIWAIERFGEGEAPTPVLGPTRKHRPCLDCASTFAGCPFPRGKAPSDVVAGEVKTDAEWGWK